jgi:cell division septation protein DedD
MRGVFDDEDRRPVQTRRETEFTLGSGTLLAMFFGLVLLCGLCFGLGYTFGHRSSSEPAATSQSPAGAQTTLQAGGTHPKPSASIQSGVAQAQQSADAVPEPDQAPGQSPPTPDGNPGGATTSAEPAGQPGSSANQNQIQAKPVLPPTPGPPQPLAATAVQPALAAPSSPAATLMVQIAAVSHPEDADVLVNALRRRGYAVVARRDADGLIHIRVGPFNTRDEANIWRQELLNDGYNAIVQP